MESQGGTGCRRCAGLLAAGSTDVANILAQANRVVCAETDSDFFITTFAGSTSLHDDVTMVVLKVDQVS